MSYVEGGVSVATYWWGTRIHLTYEEADELAYRLTNLYDITTVVSGLIPEPTVSKIIMVMAYVNSYALKSAFRRCNGDKGINIDLN